MTETTDTKALRVEIAELRLEIAKGYDRFIPETKIHIKLLERILDQLEAERQQREAAESVALALRDDMRVAREELAALRGSQEPVAWTLNDSPIGINHVVTLSEVVAKSWIDKGRSVTPLFTRQPKPVVVLPKLTVGEVMHRSGFDRQYAEGWVSANDWAINELKLAGIVVKDGE